jgi:glycine hydroxymethyltransferase
MIDTRLKKFIFEEELRQNETINLIASENYVSPAIRECLQSVLTNKYAEGYPGHRYYGGCQIVDEVENMAISEAQTLFEAQYANVQPHSGSQANQAAYLAFLNPGDDVLALSLSAGGHITHGLNLNYSGVVYRFHHYGLDAHGSIDLENVRKLAHEIKPKLIIVGATCYAKKIKFQPFREIADEIRAILMADMAHISGLVAGKVHESPVPWADVVTSTTHKTLRGPRGGLILGKKKWAKALNRAVMPGIQGGPLLHVIAAKAQCFKEAGQPEFARYTQDILKNSLKLSQEIENQGWSLVGGPSENHLLCLDLSQESFTGQEAQERLERAGIIVNKNLIPNDPRSPQETSGIRIGTAAITTKGFQEQDMAFIAKMMTHVLRQTKQPSEIREAVKEKMRCYNSRSFEPKNASPILT